MFQTSCYDKCLSCQCLLTFIYFFFSMDISAKKDHSTSGCYPPAQNTGQKALPITSPIPSISLSSSTFLLWHGIQIIGIVSTYHLRIGKVRYWLFPDCKSVWAMLHFSPVQYCSSDSDRTSPRSLPSQQSRPYGQINGICHCIHE